MAKGSRRSIMRAPILNPAISRPLFLFFPSGLTKPLILLWFWVVRGLGAGAGAGDTETLSEVSGVELNCHELTVFFSKNIPVAAEKPKNLGTSTVSNGSIVILPLCNIVEPRRASNTLLHKIDVDTHICHRDILLVRVGPHHQQDFPSEQPPLKIPVHPVKGEEAMLHPKRRLLNASTCCSGFPPCLAYSSPALSMPRLCPECSLPQMPHFASSSPRAARSILLLEAYPRNVCATDLKAHHDAPIAALVDSTAYSAGTSAPLNHCPLRLPLAEV
nr:hypothetical protein Iba_chr06aCG3230 [Ipomoea batatas]